MFRPSQRQLTTLAFVLLSLGVLHARALAQEGRPTPQPAPAASIVQVAAAAEAEAENPPATAAPVEPVEVLDDNGRRAGAGDLVVLAFDDVSVDETIPFIVETTGKVVMPVNITTLKAKKITLINDRPIERLQALDLLFQAFRFNDVGVIETDDRVIIAVLSEIPRLTTPVIGPDEDIQSFTNRGAMVTKIFGVENTDAENIAEKLQPSVPDYGNMEVDANSNQIILLADVEFCQRTGVLIEELDRNYIKVKTETFRLAHADASEIAQNILDLFDDAGTTGRTGSQPRRSAQDTRRMAPEQRRRAQQASQRTTGAAVGPTVELRVTVNVQQNSVTVSGEPSVVEEIARLIDEAWDLPRPETTKKVYHLVYTDPLKMRDMLHELLGDAGHAPRAARRAGGRRRQADRPRAGRRSRPAGRRVRGHRWHLPDPGVPGLEQPRRDLQDRGELRVPRLADHGPRSAGVPGHPHRGRAEARGRRAGCRPGQRDLRPGGIPGGHRAS
ncbi:MAG: secretin N-terminal domain-containing protein [Planctomycetota bacterium]|jgi:hypothetical protein